MIILDSIILDSIILDTIKIVKYTTKKLLNMIE